MPLILFISIGITHRGEFETETETGGLLLHVFTLGLVFVKHGLHIHFTYEYVGRISAQPNTGRIYDGNRVQSLTLPYMVLTVGVNGG